jgi:hypothetical protein
MAWSLPRLATARESLPVPPVEGLFWSLVHLHGGPAPVRRFLPELIDAMDERRAIETLLCPEATTGSRTGVGAAR